MKAILKLKDGSEFEGESFGYPKSVAGEVVFSTGMVGYPESLTDPSYIGQILILTYPLIGNYGVPDKEFWESDKMQISGLIVSDYIDTPSHFHSQMSLSAWLKKEKVPAIEIKDTRFLTKKIRQQGAMLGKIIFNKDIQWYDPNIENLLLRSTPDKVTDEQLNGSAKKTVVLVDCGGKRNVKRNLLERGIRVITVPWNYDPFQSDLTFDALIVSNGPGDPKMADKTIEVVKKAIENKIPTFGICLGHQILALAAGGDTYKLKYGHRGQNQPCILENSPRCYLTTQNHGFAVGEIPKGFKPWFTNANDQTNEGIIHTKYPFMSVQFHPEVTPGPMDTEWLFDYFLERI
ncbi:glutamine-hydrolyzing carbamoyl-phosphate synthase small subunit [Candidatus Roizmanbacteria bacterium]|nr:glutamine-hydrolyzing carbamoyl-phosphate synthase small subunit [Candidatus Roizmanbacteria bacterium]